MRVDIGHTAAVDHQGAPLKGERTTTFVIPDGVGESEAYSSILDALTYHIDLPEDQTPVWIMSDNSNLQRILIMHYGMAPKTTKPRTWGKGSQ